MVNRAALILKLKKPFVQWINETKPDKESPEVTAAEVNRERTVYLLNDLDAEGLDEWIALNCANLFASELEDWCEDESLWPQNRDMKLFKKWFAPECHPVLIDAGVGPIFEDEAPLQ